MSPDTRIVVSGAGGFVGKNLIVRLGEAGYTDVTGLGREDDADFDRVVAGADVVFHLAGANRPADPAEFGRVNHALVERLVAAVAEGGRKPLVILSSSAKSGEPGPYGESKAAGEAALLEGATSHGFTAIVYRLPNIFGKWARPDYNSAVATFCHNVARGLPIQVNDPAAPLTLLYVDDLIDQWLALLDEAPSVSGYREAPGAYKTTVGAVADTIRGFAADRDEALIDSVGVGLTRALYATFVAALPTDSFAYPLVAHTDPRGSFSEMLKTRTSGQFSYFTAHPGVTRGGHYHHTKTEKFLIVAGEARFRFRHILTGETHEVFTSGKEPVVVETIPGWSHDVTNVGDTEMVSLLWANEIFDRARPDTIASKV